MTKRALSLLLTLVMVLSLCVPAIAADGEFVAEAPADVVEEAPAAPVEPEAPEAEEPAEEPMAEEADAPEIAAAMAEEDVPLLVALGEVTHEAHFALERAVELAEPYKEKVDAGEMFGDGDPDAVINNVSQVTNLDGDAATEFNKAYKKANDMLTSGLAGVELSYDVTTKSVTDMATDLLKFIPTDGGGTHDASNGKLEGKAIAAMDLNTIAKIYPDQRVEFADGKAKAVDNTYKDAYSEKYANVRTDYSSLTTGAVKANTFTKSPWTEMYSSDYLNAMTKVAEAVVAYQKETTVTNRDYKDYAAIAKLLAAAEALEKNAAIPSAANSTALKSKVAEMDAAYDNEKKATIYVDSSLINTFCEDTAGTAKNSRVKVNSLMDNSNTGLNGFVDGATLYDYYMAMAEMEKDLVKQANTAKIVDVKVATKKTITFNVAIPDEGQQKDGKKYGYAVEIGGKWSNLEANTSAAETTDKKKLVNQLADDAKNDTPSDLTADTFQDQNRTDGMVGFKTTVQTIYNLANADFKDTDKVTIHLYSAMGTSTTRVWQEVDHVDVKFPAGMYLGPQISAKDGDIVVNYNDGSDTISYTKLSSGFTGSIDQSGQGIVLDVYLDREWPTPDYDSLTSHLYAYNSSNKNVGTGSKSKGEDWTAAAPPSGGSNVDHDTIDIDEYNVTASTLQVKLGVQLQGTDGEAVHEGGVGSVKLDSITTWKELKKVEKLLKDIRAVVRSDYELKATIPQNNIHPTVDTTAKAWQVIDKDINDLQAYVNGGTYANSRHNRQDIITIGTDLVAVFNYMQAKSVSIEDLLAEMLKANDLESKEYTYDSWKNVAEAMEDANKAVTDGLESEINAAYAALRAAMNGLVKEGAVDKTALQAAVTKAGALKEADYTPESWAANKPEIDAAVKAAQNVLDNADATTSQVATALNNLNAAMGNLEPVKPEGPQAPASGNGWVYYEGDDYFFKDGKYVTNYWAGLSNGGSKWNIWYYLGSDGKLVKGFHYITDDNGTGWYMLQQDDTNGTRGAMLSGYQNTGIAGTGWFQTRRGADYGKCTWTASWGDYNAADNTWGTAHTAH